MMAASFGPLDFSLWAIAYRDKVVR
jgi:hypothetical protein